jgi:peptide/nickel transport system substrate-binding protein
LEGGVVKFRRWFVLLGCLLAFALLAVLAVACGGETTPGEEGTTATTVSDMPRSILECPQGPQSADAPQYGGTLTIIHNHTPTNIGAWWEASRFADWQLGRFAVENLVGLNEQAQPVPQLATDWVEDPVAKTITFTLRQGVKFHDGTDFNAEAAKWNLDMQKDGPKNDLKGIESVEVVDPYTIRVNLQEWDALFVQKLCSSCGGKMTSPAAYEQYGLDELKLHPVGTGPFEFESYEPDVVLKFKKFADYWQEGLPYLDAVEIRFVAEVTTALMSFKSGEAQYLYHLEFESAPELEALGNKIYSRTMALYGLAGDSKNPKSPTNDIRVRRAIAYAIDGPTIVNAVYGGYCPYINQLAVEGMSGYNPAVKGYPYDPVKAKELLAEVGITPETPWKTKLTYPTSDDRTEVYVVVQEQLKAVGIDCKLVPLEYAPMLEVTEDGWDGLLGLSISYNFETAYSSMLGQYLSQDAYMGGQWIWIPDEWQAAYEAVLPLTDMAARETAYQELNRMAVDDYCMVVPLFGLGGVIAESPDLHDCGFCVKCTTEFLPETMWLSGATGTTGGAATTATTTK